MSERLSPAANVLAFLVAKGRAVLARAWQLVMGEQADSYRPEAHYLRGPGPKWRAKRAQMSPRQ
jgi:hypothetical protein